MLPDIVVKLLKRLPDERGSFTEVFRKDWTELLGTDVVAQANLSTTYPGTIRAWHRHLRGQVDYFLVVKGALKICVFDDETEELDEIISTGQNLQLVRVPGKFWHGFKAIGDEQALLVYFTTNLYDPANPDEERRLWNDKTLIPKSINGKTEDPRVGKPWDWNHPPHK
ncbi:MAG: dTDP-4-dehydrorhamnose 3,5-epimerase family protein [Candidatus Bathyarchaeota archaeon]|nr:dTDP-4-dehydrorhamnose 3,5-epimerase family protein [Candidatus Bathyarchaeota archaeon]